MAVPRRIVTGTNAQGKSHVVQDGPTPGFVDFSVLSMAELWKVDTVPADNSLEGDPADVDRIALEPPVGGVTCRIFTLEPETPGQQLTDEQMAVFLERYIGIEAHDDPGDPAWHTTKTVDLIVVLSGEMDMELDEDRVHLGPGDVVIQRGTRHAWRNTGTEPCTAVAMLISAQPLDGNST